MGKSTKQSKQLTSRTPTSYEGSHSEGATPRRYIKGRALEPFLVTMRNANLIAYLEREKDLDRNEDEPRTTLCHLWQGPVTFKNIGAEGSFEVLADSLQCGREASGHMKVWFNKRGVAVEVVKGDARRFAAMAVAVNELHSAERPIFVDALETLSQTLREAGWNWPDTLQFLRAVAFACDHQFDDEAMSKASRSHSIGTWETLESVLAGCGKRLLSYECIHSG